MLLQLTLCTGGVTDRAGVAALHYPMAKLAADGVDLGRLADESRGVGPDTEVAGLIPKAKQQQRMLSEAGIAEPVATFINTDTWIDLEKVFKESWITGDSTGLKMIGSLAGYEWPVDDPGGGLSMVRHAESTSDDPDAEARAWLLDYNRGDVEATLAIRRWLSMEGSTWPEVDAD